MTAFRLYFAALFKGGVAQCLAGGPFLSHDEAMLNISHRPDSHRYRVVETDLLTMKLSPLHGDQREG